MRVLMADGDVTLLEAAHRYLSRRGYAVEVASNGLDCVAHLRREVPDVVVLDRKLQWGGSDGVQEFMLQAPGLSQIPVILTSDRFVPERSDGTVSPPLELQLQKPYRLADLLLHLQACGADNRLDPT